MVQVCIATRTICRPGHLIIVEAMALWTHGSLHKSEVIESGKTQFPTKLHLRIKMEGKLHFHHHVASSVSLLKHLRKLIIESFSSFEKQLANAAFRISFNSVNCSGIFKHLKVRLSSTYLSNM